MRNPCELSFAFNGVAYEVEIADVLIYPQGFAAVAKHLEEFRGMNMLCDIGHGTMSMMFINSSRPVPGRIYTELMGVHQCVLSMKDAAMKEFHARLEDEQMNNVHNLDGRRVWGFKGIRLMADSGLRSRNGFQRAETDDNPFT